MPTGILQFLLQIGMIHHPTHQLFGGGIGLQIRRISHGKLLKRIENGFIFLFHGITFIPYKDNDLFMI